MALVDTHCHLGHISDGADAAIARALEAGVSWMVNVGMGTTESAEVVRLARERPGIVRAAVGVHPNDLAEFLDDPQATMDRLRELAMSPGVVAVGETGLDLYRDRSAPADQEAAFRAHIALAKQTGRTLVVHCRDAERRVIEVLDSEGPPARVVMHCFSGGVEHARECAERSFFCSFAGNVTFKKSEDLREAAGAVPSELLLAETDSPYLAPEPHRGRENGPHLVGCTVRVLAEARRISFEELSEQVAANAEAAFPG